MRIIRFIRRLRISECNDWRTFTDPKFGTIRSFAPIMIAFGNIRMDNYRVIGTFMVMGYGFQLRLHV